MISPLRKQNEKMTGCVRKIIRAMFERNDPAIMKSRVLSPNSFGESITRSEQVTVIRG